MDNTQLLTHSKKWDRAGVWIASICMVHCLLLPFLVGGVPVLHTWVENPWIEFGLLGTAILIGFVSFITSFRKHRNLKPVAIGFIGLGLLVANLINEVGHHEHAHHHGGEIDWLAHFEPLLVAGGLTLIIGHLYNLYVCHCFCDTTCDHEEHKH